MIEDAHPTTKVFKPIEEYNNRGGDTWWERNSK